MQNTTQNSSSHSSSRFQNLSNEILKWLDDPVADPSLSRFRKTRDELILLAYRVNNFTDSLGESRDYYFADLRSCYAIVGRVAQALDAWFERCRAEARDYFPVYDTVLLAYEVQSALVKNMIPMQDDINVEDLISHLVEYMEQDNPTDWNVSIKRFELGNLLPIW